MAARSNSSLTKFLASASRVTSEVAVTERLNFGNRVSCELSSLAVASTAVMIGFLKAIEQLVEK